MFNQLDVPVSSAPTAEAKALTHRPLCTHLEGRRCVLHMYNAPLLKYSLAYCGQPISESAASKATSPASLNIERLRTLYM